MINMDKEPRPNKAHSCTVYWLHSCDVGRRDQVQMGKPGASFTTHPNLRVPSDEGMKKVDVHPSFSPLPAYNVLMSKVSAHQICQ